MIFFIDTSDTDSPKWFDWDAVSSSSSTSSCDTSSTVSDWSPVRLNIPEASQAFTCSTISPASKMQACRGKNVSSKQWYVISVCKEGLLQDSFLILTINTTKAFKISRFSITEQKTGQKSNLVNCLFSYCFFIKFLCSNQCQIINRI